MVALQSGVDALVSVGTAELVQATGHAAAAVLVPPGATVQVAVAALLLRHTGTGEPILAVPLAVAQLRLQDALGSAASATSRAQVLVIRTCDGRAVGLVALVGAVVVSVAVEVVRDAPGVRAPELGVVAGREI